MQITSIDFLNKACGGKLLGRSKNDISGVKIDSREAAGEDLFVCVVGEINDGHKFADSAYQNGCRAFLMSDPEAAETITRNHDDASVILVPDTVKAFEKMAEAYLGQFDVKKIAVTGSVGKTTTPSAHRRI